MKIRSFTFAVLLFVSSLSVKAQYITIDPNFSSWLFTNGYSGCLLGNQLDTTCPTLQNATTFIFPFQSVSSLEGIQYFINLDTLYISNNNITSISALPPTLEALDLNENQLSSLPPLPNTLSYLGIANNNFSVVSGPLPDSLHWFECFGNNITSLPTLPSHLEVFSCEMNQLTSLPALPSTLHTLWATSNQFTSLPTLPQGLQMLYCGNNQLTSLPTLPLGLIYLHCEGNQLTSIPTLASQMNDLHVNDNPNLACLPPVSYIQSSIDISNTAITCLPNVINHPNSWPQIDTLPLCDLYGSGCAVNWNVAGYTYQDANSNCIDNNETRLPNIKAMLFHNGNLEQQMYTNDLGNYSFNTDLNGGYTVSIDASNSPFNVTCPSGAYTVNVTAVDSFDDGGNFALECNGGYDVGVNAIIRTAGVFFPNDTATVSIHAGDLATYFTTTCNTSGLSGQVVLTFTGPVAYAGSNGLLAPTSVTGNSITWNISDFSSVDFFNAFRVKFLTNTTASIGEFVCMNVNITPASDNNSVNNQYQSCFAVTNSFDPNIKEASPIATTSPNQWISYTIHFQNTGNAAAHNILVMDTLDANLDWSSFQLTGTSHQAVTQILDGGIAKFTFLNIMLPDSTSNEAQSHGWIQYRIKTNTNLAVNTTIDNTAAIYFDFNAPVITNTTHNLYELTSVDVSTKAFELNIYPNPASQFVKINYPTSVNEPRIIISDMLGRSLSEQSLTNSGNDRVDVSNLSQGTYRVELLGGDKVLVINKLVVIR